MEEAVNMPSNTQEFCLRWNNFHSSLVSALDGFKNDLDFVDVTLACEGQFLKAHKMLLSACSVFFRDLLKANPCQHPIVILPTEVRFGDLEKMLRFIYQGEVNVQQENLARFLKTAEMLKIRGLADDNEKRTLRSSSPKQNDSSSSAGSANNERSSEGRSVSPKRPRLSIEAQSSMDRAQSPIEENSRLSGADSDTEMLPVKQELIELKECDFENADADSFIPEAFLHEGQSATCSTNSSNTQLPPQSHPAAPPPPGPLLPSYVPPPQLKAHDESSIGSNHDELSQGSFTSLTVVDHPVTTGGGGGVGGRDVESVEIVSSWEPGETPKSSSAFSRFSLPRSTSAKIVCVTKSPTTNSSPSQCSSSEYSSMDCMKVCGQVKTPIMMSSSLSTNQASQIASSPSIVYAKSPTFSPPLTSSPSTGSSISIWHPPHQTSPSDAAFTSVGCSSGLVVFNALPTAPSSGCTILAVPTGGNLSLTCDICSKTFTSRSNLNKHKRVQHSGEEYICPICQRTFKNRYYIKDHVNLCSSQSNKKPVVINTISGESEAEYYDSSPQSHPTSLVKRANIS